MFSPKLNQFIILQGKVEVELELLTKEDAEATPAGKAREEPQPLSKPKYVLLCLSLFLVQQIFVSLTLLNNIKKNCH